MHVHTHVCIHTAAYLFSPILNNFHILICTVFLWPMHWLKKRGMSVAAAAFLPVCFFGLVFLLILPFFSIPG